MATIDLSQFAVGGATRPDSFTGLDPSFLQALQTFVGAAPPEIQSNLRILSGYRSPERQEQLWNEALAKYGSPDVARKWVAPPGRSLHNHGSAVDLRYLDDAAKAWAHENARNYGLHFPLSNEPWHIEPIGARGGGVGSQIVASAKPTAPQASGTPAPALPSPREVGSAPAVAAAPAGNPAPVGPNPLQNKADEPAGLGAIFAAMAPSMGGAASAMTGGGQEPRAADFGTGDPMGATMAAMQGAEMAKGLMGRLTPDVAGLMGLGKGARKVG